MTKLETLQKELQKYKSLSYHKSNEYDELGDGWSEEHWTLAQEIYKLDNHCCYLSNLIHDIKNYENSCIYEK